MDGRLFAAARHRQPAFGRRGAVGEARGCRRIELYTSFEEPAGDELRTRFRDLVRRRAEGVPVAYLVGHREFFSLDFRVTPDVLIPRPETEFLVMACLDRIKTRETGAVAVADVGTGSGIVAISVARQAPQARVTAIDLSPAALVVARDNARRLGVAERVEFVEGDLLAGIAAGRVFDIIASNPPYVSEAEFNSLARDVQAYEPRQALVAGPTGMEVIERLVPQAAERLAPGGRS